MKKLLLASALGRKLMTSTTIARDHSVQAATSAQTSLSHLTILKPHFFMLDNHYANENPGKEESTELSRIMMDAVERAGKRLKKQRESHSETG